MSDRPCFGPHWIGKIISFYEQLSSFWVLTEKLGDKNWQLSEALYKSLGGKSSAGFGTFTCQNANVPHEIAIMRITMQIPHGGSDLLPRSEILKQATPDQIPVESLRELEALKILTDRGCDSAPTLLGYRLDVQGPDDLLPGGFILYQLTSQAPGIRLDPVRWSFHCLPEDDRKEANFWKFKFKERENIRQAVKFAWLNCKKAGIVAARDRGHLVWDGVANKITIVGFHDWDPDEPGIIWRNIDWIVWGLAQPPRGFAWAEVEEAESDTSTWIM